MILTFLKIYTKFLFSCMCVVAVVVFVILDWGGFSKLSLAQEGGEEINLILPPKIYAVVGEPLEIYLNNIILRRDNTAGLEFQFNFDGQANLGVDKWVYTPVASDEGRLDLAVIVKNSTGQSIASGQSEVLIVKKESSDNIHWLPIGDSLTYNTDTYPKFVKELSDQDLSWQAVSIGTRQAGGVQCEGYGGKTWDWFLNEQDSPFVDSGQVNLDKYFDDLGSDNPQIITFLLGINDCMPFTPNNMTNLDNNIDQVLDDAEELVNKFHQKLPGTKIGIGLLPPPNADEDSFQMFNNYTYWRWRQIQHRLVYKYIERFGDKEVENIFLVPLYLSLDSENGYGSDPVHPNATGSRQIARGFYYWMKSFASSGYGTPSLQLTKQSNRQQISIGQEIEYSLNYLNKSTNQMVRNVLITDNIPAGVKYITGSADNGGVFKSNPNRIEWQIGTIDALDSGILKFKVRVE